MKISMDKKYRTRDGRDVRLLCVDANSHRSVVIRDGFGDIYQVYPNGRFISSDHPHEFDLIEYHEPEIRTIWVNVYEDGSVSAYREEFSAQQAFDNNARPHVVIAQPVTFEVKK